MVDLEPQNPKLEAALTAAARGFRVFPIKADTKDQPLLRDWPNKASSDPETVRGWWSNYPDANIGICTTGMLVVDVDIKKGKAGFASLMDLEIDLDTYTVATPSNGLHLYFRDADVPNSVELLGPGLDVRSRNGYVLGAGSTIGGRPYLVRSSTLPVGAEPILLERALEAARHRDHQGIVQRPTTGPLDTIAAVDRATHFLRDEARLAVEGAGGDQTTFKVAAAVKDMGISQPMALVLMTQHWNPRCSPPWSIEELQVKTANAYRYGALPAGAASPEHLLQGIDIPPEPKPDATWFHHGDFVELDDTWLFYETLPSRGVAMITGSTGSGKTFMAGELARCLATGKSFFGVEPDDPGATLFIFSGTEGAGFEHRMAALEEKVRLPIAARTLTSSLSEGNNLAALVEELEAKCASMLAEFGLPVRMIVFETLSASGLLKDENDNTEAAKAINALSFMSRRLGVLFVISHHPPKSGAGTRGAGALDGSPDFIIEINRDGKAPVRDVELRKARNAPEKRLGTFTLVPVEIGSDKRGRPVTSCVISQGEARTELARTMAHSEAFFRSVEFALVEEQKKDPEAEWAERALVQSEFQDQSGIKDKSWRSQQFRKIWTWAEGLGAVETKTVGATQYIRRKEPIT